MRAARCEGLRSSALETAPPRRMRREGTVTNKPNVLTLKTAGLTPARWHEGGVCELLGTYVPV